MTGDLRRPTALLLDLDGTLLMDGVLEHAVEKASIEAAAAVPGLAASAIHAANLKAFGRYFPEIEEAWTLGRMSSADVVREAWRRTLASLGVDDPALAEHMQERFSAFARAEHRVYDDTMDLLERASGHLPMALITNGASDLQREKLEVTGIERYFDCVMVSGELGAAKPDPRIFETALSKLGVPAAEAWHVGDNLVADVGGALAAGATGVWLNRHDNEHDTAKPVPALTVRSLHELAGVLELPA